MYSETETEGGVGDFSLSEHSEGIVATVEHATLSALVFLLASRTWIDGSLYSS